MLSLPQIQVIFTLIALVLPAQGLSDSSTDPKNDPHNPLKYIPSNSLTAVALFMILQIAVLQTLCIMRWGAKWMLSMTIGAYLFSVGIGLRFGLHAHPDSKILYIAEYILVVLSPCAFIAADYVLLGRLANHLNADQHLLVPSRVITRIYVSSDIITFLIQAAGGGISAGASDAKQGMLGSRVFLGGLVVQLASFASFWCIYLIFLYRVYTCSPEIWRMDNTKPWYKSWHALAAALFISCIGILIRSGFRVAELSQGFNGPLTTSELLFYGLDTLPLFIAIAFYVPFWPGRFISTSTKVKTVAEDTGAENAGLEVKV